MSIFREAGFQEIATSGIYPVPLLSSGMVRTDTMCERVSVSHFRNKKSGGPKGLRHPGFALERNRAAHPEAQGEAPAQRASTPGS